MCDDGSAANDNIPPTRLDDLVAVTIDDFVIRAESDIEEGEEPIDAAPALIELAAAAMRDVCLNSELGLPLIIEMVTGRAASMLMFDVERSKVLHKPYLTVVKPTDRQAGFGDDEPTSDDALTQEFFMLMGGSS